MAAPSGPVRGPAVLRLVLRLVLVVALAVLLVLNGLKHAPAIAAALSPAATTPAAASPTSAPVTPSVSTSASASASASTSLPSVSTGGSGGGSGGGSSSGGGGSGGGGTTSTPKPTVDSLTATSVACSDPSAPVNSGSGGMSPTVTISWSTSNAKAVYFGQNTSDAQADSYTGGTVSPSGSIDVNWPCGDATDEFAVTAIGADGTKVTKTITAKNTGDVY